MKSHKRESFEDAIVVVPNTSALQRWPKHVRELLFTSETDL
jgi:hypothetical protein